MNESVQAVFLSYASEDTEAAQRISDALRSAGLEVWFDRSELRGGDAWDAMIRRQIRTCSLFIPLISANSRVRSEGYFRLEWKLAVDRSYLMASDRAFLVPVVIDGARDELSTEDVVRRVEEGLASPDKVVCNFPGTHSDANPMTPEVRACIEPFVSHVASPAGPRRTLPARM